MSFKVKLPTMELGAVYDHAFNYYLQDEYGNKTSADLTGYGAQMDIRKGTTLIAHLSTDNNLIKIVGNRIMFAVPADKSKEWSFTEATYDFLLLPENDPTKARLLLFGAINGYKVGTQLVV